MIGDTVKTTVRAHTTNRPPRDKGFHIRVSLFKGWLNENPDRKFINADKNEKIENVLNAYNSI